MAIRTVAQRQDLAQAFADKNPYGAAFTADPGASGTPSSEFTGGSPAYARKAITWSPPDGAALLVGFCIVDHPAGLTLTHQSPCTALTGTRVSDAQPLNGGPVTSPSQTTTTLTFKLQF